MPGSMLATDAKISVRPTGRQCGRLRVALLMLGWLAFWLTAAVQPCDRVPAAEQNQRSAALSTSSNSPQPAAGHPHEPAPANTHCPDVSAAGIVVTFAVTPQGGNFHTQYPSPSPQLSVAPRIGAAPDPANDAWPSTPTIPLYLRNQRFLI